MGIDDHFKAAQERAYEESIRHDPDEREYTWYFRAEDELDAIAKLSLNWDGYGSFPFSTALIAKARDFAEKMGSK